MRIKVSEQTTTKIGKFLKHKRKAAGLSQNDVAKKMNYTSCQFVSIWERGLSAPPPETFIILCTLYHLTKDDIAKLSNIIGQGFVEYTFKGKKNVQV